jgi:hypothetical protein
MDQVGAISPVEVDQWVNSAEPGESKVYAWGPSLPQRAPGVSAAKKAHAAGLVTFTTRTLKPSGRREYVMQRIRRARRTLSAAEVRASSERTRDPQIIVMDALRKAARYRRPCPSNNELARAAALPDAYAASYIVRKLQKAAKISVDFDGPYKRRCVTILSNGARTAPAQA